MGNADPTHYAMRGSRHSPKRTVVDTGDAEFVVGDDVNPVEYFLGSILGCINSTGTMVARDMDIDIESLEIAIEGDLDYSTYLGEESDERTGLQGLDVSLDVETAGDADLDAWLSAVKARCPVTDNVESETPLHVSLE